VADIRIHRPHRLGLTKAREIAWQWAEEVEQRFDMACTVVEEDAGDTVEFTRAGVDGRLLVRADHFDLEARLGFLIGAFSRRIEAEIEQNLDALLAAHARPKAAATSPRKAAGKPEAPQPIATRGTKANPQNGAAPRATRSPPAKRTAVK
jgi:putative polyhydroxyalkanoate system protein